MTPPGLDIAAAIQHAETALASGHYAEAADVCSALLTSGRAPAGLRYRIEELRLGAQARLRPLLPAARQPLTAEGATADRAGGLPALLNPHRPTAVVDIGANPIDGDPPYAEMLRQNLCTVVGFEPQPDALAELQRRSGPAEVYLPWAVGDGEVQTWHDCAVGGMSSSLRPDPRTLGLFHLFPQFGEVVRTSQIETRRLDDIHEIGDLDLLKIDIQGSELSVFRNGRVKLAGAIAIHTEVSFVPLYENQPTFGEVDCELRSQGFVPHCFAALKRWPLVPYVAQGQPRLGLNQLLEADAVYVRDFTRPETMSDEQFKHLALVAHLVYGSFDLALRCVVELARRGVIPQAAPEEYADLLTPQSRAAGA